MLYLALCTNSVAGVVTATYNGVSMTEIASRTASFENRVFRLVNPASGSNTVAITLANAQVGAAIALSCTGVDQTTPDDTPVTETDGDESLDVPGVQARDLALDCIMINANTDMTPGAGQTQRGEQGGTFGGQRTECSTEAATGTVTMSWTPQHGSLTFHVGVRVRAAPAPQLTVAAQMSQGPITGAFAV